MLIPGMYSIIATKTLHHKKAFFIKANQPAFSKFHFLILKKYTNLVFKLQNYNYEEYKIDYAICYGVAIALTGVQKNGQ